MAIAGTLSVVGYTRLQPYLQSNRIVHDTCGVNNLHGMPGILGGLAGAVSAAVAQDSDYGDASTVWGARAAAGDNRSAGEQAGYQIAALVTTVVIASLGGIITGAFIKCIRSSLDGGHTHYFHDGDYWEGVCDLEGAPASLAFEDVGTEKFQNGDLSSPNVLIPMEVSNDPMLMLQARVLSLESIVQSLGGNAVTGKSFINAGIALQPADLADEPVGTRYAPDGSASVACNPINFNCMNSPLP